MGTIPQFHPPPTFLILFCLLLVFFFKALLLLLDVCLSVICVQWSLRKEPTEDVNLFLLSIFDTIAAWKINVLNKSCANKNPCRKVTIIEGLTSIALSFFNLFKINL